MSGEWRVFREYGFRYWVAWCLVRAAYRVKDTTFYQVIRIPGGSAVMVNADTWGTGVSSAVGVYWDAIDERGEGPHGYPQVRDFDDRDQALDWMHGEETA